jgi:hypothetical protein
MMKVTLHCHDRFHVQLSCDRYWICGMHVHVCLYVIHFWRYMVLIHLRLGHLLSYITTFPLVSDSTMGCSVNVLTHFLKVADSLNYTAYILCSISNNMHSEHVIGKIMGYACNFD